MKNVEDVYPLSAMQEGMLFDALYEPGSGAYVMQVSSRIEGDFDVAAFQRSWEVIVERHPCLRSALIWERVERPLQIVRKEVTLSWDQPDWRGLPDNEQEKALQHYIQAERERGFNFVQAPLMRMALIRLKETQYQFLWSCSHLVMDGWSSNIVFEELFTYYRCYSEGREPVRSRAKPYRDLIGWMQQQNKSDAEHFWRSNLADFTLPTVFESEQPKLIQDRYDCPQYRQLFTLVNSDALSKLQSIARQHRLTLNTLVQGAWAWLLGSYSGAGEVVFGVTFTVRPVSLSGADTIVGPMVNTLPMRVAIRRELPLLDWLKVLQNHQVNVRKYEYSSLVEVKGWSEVPPKLPLFESIVVFQNYPMARGTLELCDNLRFLSTQVITSTAYPLTLVVEPAEQMSLNMLFDQRRFSASTIEGTLHNLQMLLVAIADNPEQRVGELTLLTSSERQQLLMEWNDTATSYQGGSCIHELFEKQAQKTPQGLAVQFEEQQLTYDDLDRQANKLAHYLRHLGVRAEALVGVCLERSLEMVVSLMGVLKAGGAYVPIDPSYPPDRTAFMLADAGVKVLITQEKLLQELPQGSAFRICIDAQWSEIAKQPAGNPRAEIGPQNLAYVIYTSGSTGKPKGAMNQHGAVRNRLLWMQEHYGLDSTDGVLQKTPFSFDVSVWEFFWPLMTGARLIMARPGAQGDGEYLAQVISEQQVTTLHFVPSMLAAFVEGQYEERCSSLRRVICSGEALPEELAKRFFEHFTTDLHNLYGPTEAAVDVTYWQCERQAEISTVPIGRPIANIQMYILNEDLLPVPIKMAGEIYIAGEGLGRGYWQRPDLTAERFQPNPFAIQPGGRLYRTGDQGRYRSDGAIEFIGRLDYQVKIRGFRIELGEIEAVLLSHPQVERAVVLAAEGGTGDKQLVAYLVSNAEIMPDELRELLKSRLPDYMVPSVFVSLDKMPLTPSGKIDRRSLPALDRDMASGETPYIEPRTPVEQQLAQIWSEILGRDRIGVNDNFFALGGHSLLATRVVSRVKDTFHTPLSLRQLFEIPTIAGLSEVLEQISRNANGDGLKQEGEAIGRLTRVRRPPSPAAAD